MIKVSLDIRSNVAASIAKLGAETSEKLKQAQVNALNRTIDQLRTEAGREIRKEYNVTLRGIRQAAAIRYARAGNLFPWTELTFKGRPINLVEFGARALNPWNIKGRRHNRRGGGVSVQVKVAGGRKVIAGAFLATIKSGQNAGKQGVFRRSGPEHWAPIKFLPSLSLPEMAERRAISAALLKFADEKFTANFEQQVVYQLTRG